MTRQETNDAVVYWSRTWKGTMGSKLVTEKINDMKLKLGSKVRVRTDEAIVILKSGGQYDTARDARFLRKVKYRLQFA